MAGRSNPLVISHVIGDVLDMFIPTVNISVYFGSKQVTNGCHIKPSMAINPPNVTIASDMDQLYTLIMIDPDAPNPSEPSLREMIHWIVVNIPGGTNPFRGEEVLPYMNPWPTIGIHRFVMVLFQQKCHFNSMQQPSTRVGFNTRYFARQLDLGLPVGAVYFNSQKESTIKRR